jgi:transcriptional regulator with XRE-family HTH domain
MITRGMEPKELRQLRESMGWTQFEFAMKLGLQPNSYARLERGEREISLTVAKLARLIVTLFREGIDVDRL